MRKDLLGQAFRPRLDQQLVERRPLDSIPEQELLTAGNFSTVGINHSTSRYIASSAGPVCRALSAPRSFMASRQEIGAGGSAPRTPKT